MTQSIRDDIYGALDGLLLIDPHTHIDPHAPASKNLADILGYHYYTELAHSAGMPHAQIEEPGLDPKEKVGRLVAYLDRLDNTIQASWLVEICQTFFDFGEAAIRPDNWEALYDKSAKMMSEPGWSAHVLKSSNLEAVFLTNDFDDPLEGFDTKTFIPCLRTDDLVFHLAKPEVRERLERASGVAVNNPVTLRQAIHTRFEHFVSKGARACAISLPPDFDPEAVDLRIGSHASSVTTALSQMLKSDATVDDRSRRVVANFVFWTLAEFCDEFQLPFDLMIGVNRGVYADGVYQGKDLFDSRVSLIQYEELFNAFGQVAFPISVLASVTNQELVSYAWIFPNVVAHGHWWYSNTPSFIERDAAARLEAVPRNKQIGYYSDMYKLEFALPKFNMYKRTLAKILADQFVIDRGWNEHDAIALGKQVLRGNVERVFNMTE